MENPLALVITEKTLGNLKTNALEIKAYVAAKLEEYSLENYAGDAPQAAKARAETNKSIKILNDRRIELEKEWLSPFLDFKGIVCETISMMKEASGKLDAIVKAAEEKEKAEKKAQIAELWNSKNFALVPLERVFSAKWLNKTAKISNIDDEMNGTIERIKGDLKSLDDTFGEDSAILKELYLSTLDLQSTLNKGAELKANRERLAQLEAEKKTREENEAAENATFGIKTEKDVSLQVSEKTDSAESEIESKPKAEKEYLFCVYGDFADVETVKKLAQKLQIESVASVTLKGTAAQIERFRKELEQNGLWYEKTPIVTLKVATF